MQSNCFAWQNHRKAAGTLENYQKPSKKTKKLGNTKETLVKKQDEQVNIPGSSQKQPSTKKFQHPPEAPGPPVSMLLTIASQWPEQEWLFFEGSAKHCFHITNIELGGVSNCPRYCRVQVGWLFSFEEPDKLTFLPNSCHFIGTRTGVGNCCVDHKRLQENFANKLWI